jgi:putative methionine-R-sulfoxide reductase with GAF domain
MLYEIHMPHPDGQTRSEQVHGDNWLDALRRGLAVAGLPAPTRNLSCDLQDDDSVVITDTGSGQVFRVIPVRTPASGATRKNRKSSGPVSLIKVTTPSESVEGGPRGRNSASSGPWASREDTGTRDLADPFGDDDAMDESESGIVTSGVQPMRISFDRTPDFGTSTGPGPADSLGDMDPFEGAPGSDAARSLPGGDWEVSTVDLPERDLDRTISALPTPVRDAATEQAELDRRMKAMEIEMAELAHLGRDIHDACNFTLDAARAHISCQAGAILLIDARDRCLYFAAARGPKAAVVSSRRIPLEVGIAGASIRQRKAISVADPGRDPRWASGFANSVGYHPRSILCAPVFAGKKAFGVLELLDREQFTAFTEADTRVLSLAARRLGAHFASLLPGRPTSH